MEQSLIVKYRGVMGGLLSLGSWVRTFPSIDTTKEGTAGLTPSQVNHRSTIQGKFEPLKITVDVGPQT